MADEVKARSERRLIAELLDYIERHLWGDDEGNEPEPRETCEVFAKARALLASPDLLSPVLVAARTLIHNARRFDYATPAEAERQAIADMRVLAAAIHAHDAVNGEALTFGSKVRAARLGKEVTLRNGARSIGVSPTYLSKLERHVLSEPPTSEVLERIAEVFKVDGRAN